MTIFDKEKNIMDFFRDTETNEILLLPNNELTQNLINNIIE